MKIDEFLDIPYLDTGLYKHKMDVYAPKGSGKRPIIVFVHGGGWKKTDRRVRFPGFTHMHRNVGLAFANEGFVTVLPSYRLSSASWPVLLTMCFLIALVGAGIAAIIDQTWWIIVGTFGGVFIFGILFQFIWKPCFWREHVYWPMHGEDVAASVGYVARHAHEWGGDPSNIVLAGHSAGAHIVSMLGLRPGFLEKHGVGVISKTRSKELAAPDDIVISFPGDRGRVGIVRGILSMSGVYSADRLRAHCFPRYVCIF